MAKGTAELSEERGRLLERIAHQRNTLAQDFAPLQDVEQTAARVGSLVQEAMQRMQRHPLPVAMVVAALVVWRPRGALRWARRGVWVWSKWATLHSAMR